MSKVPSLFYALCFFLLCAFDGPAHAEAPEIGPGIDLILLRANHRWAATDSVSNQNVPASASFQKGARFHPAWLGFDKVLHFSFSAGLVGISYHGSRVVLEKDQETSQWMAGVGAGLLGIWKEWRDPHISIGDLVANALGIAAGVTLFTAW